MKIRFSGLPVGSCFIGKRGGIRKKVEDDRYAVVEKNGRERSRNLKGDPNVEPTSCPLHYVGIGLRGHPDQVVEMGDGGPRKNRKK